MIHMPTPMAQRADGLIAPVSRPVRDLVVGPTHSGSPVERIRVRVVHGVPLTASGISAVLSSSGEFEVSVSHVNGAGHAAGLSHSMADVLVADVDAGLRALGSGSLYRHVLIVAQDDGEMAVRKALGNGARGFLLHTCGAEELRAAVKTIIRGGTAYAPEVARRIVESFTSEQLTVRELEVLQLMVHGCSDKDIAKKLLIALGTVKSHMKAILTKLGAARRTEAAAIAQRRGITRLDRPFVSNHWSAPT
jgi:DNA-binding NarL/FixJ family response regulator